MGTGDIRKMRHLSDDLEEIARKLKSGNIEPGRAAREIDDVANEIERLARKLKRDLPEH